MKYSILLVLLLSFFSCKTTFRPIQADRFEWFYKTRKIYKILIDTRTEKLFRKSNLERSVHVFIHSKNLKKQIANKLKSKPKDVWVLFVYAHNKQDTKTMLKELKKIYSYHWPFSGPTAIYYPENGFISIGK